MNRMILPLVLALIVMPLALADAYRTANTPGMTGSPAVAMGQSQQGDTYQAPPLYTAPTMGVSRDVRFLPPVSNQQLQLDQNGVVTTAADEPVEYGTTGGVIDHGHNPWYLSGTTQVGPYFSSNQQGFKTGVVQTSKYKKWGGKSFTTFFLGYNPAKAVLKQWSGGMAPDKYIHAGIPNMIKAQPQYVNPGLPAQITPGSVQPGTTQ